MIARRLEYQEGFPVNKPIYLDEYPDDAEISKWSKDELQEQLNIEKERYYALQEQIRSREGNIESFKGPGDAKVDYDSADIARLENEADIKANNIVKLCNALGIEKIDLRKTPAENTKK